MINLHSQNPILNKPREQGEKGPGTLRSGLGDTNTLSYILLFYNAHAYWTSKREIFCRRRLNLLEGIPISSGVDKSEIQSSRSYPVFSQHKQKGKDVFVFLGHYKIQSIRYLQPHSSELREYLTAKFGAMLINAAWTKKIAKKWIAVRLEKDESRDGEPPSMIHQKQGVN